MSFFRRMFKSTSVDLARRDLANSWEPGDVFLDQYEVKQVFTGGMGAVYRVRHRGWNLDLAVKRPHPEYLKTTADIENFEREAETWANLHLHPHVVTCHYVRRVDGIPLVFAEFIDGGNLGEWIRGRKLYADGPQRALARILDVAIQIAWALDFAHASGLVHQDVKPANVLLTPDGVAKLTDFGLARARALAGHGRPPVTSDSILVSVGGMTPAYASPEQFADRPLSRRTDMWSWGLAVLEMFQGSITWPAGPAAEQALEAYLTTGPNDPAIPTMPRALVDLLRLCFRRDPETRPGDMAGVATALQAIYEEVTGRRYPRGMPQAPALLADSLNNRALSMLDLGHPTDAERLWDEALRAQPQHPYATSNLSLHLWRTARIADDEAVRRLEAVRTSHGDDWVPTYLCGLLHLERRDREAAVEVLERAAALTPGEETVQAALKAARLTSPGFRCVGTFSEYQGTGPVLVTPDGQYALSAGYRSLQLWNLASGSCICILDTYAETEPVESIALSPDGSFAFSETRSRDSLRSWDLATGSRNVRFIGHGDPIASLAVTPDGRFVLSGSGDTGAIVLSEATTGRRVQTFTGHRNSVMALAVTADGRYALSGSLDRTLGFWELATGRCIGLFEGHTHIVTSVALTSEGRFAVSGSFDDTLRLWDLTTSTPPQPFCGSCAGGVDWGA